MNLILFKRLEKAVSSFLILVFIFEMISPLALQARNATVASAAGSSTIGSSLSSMVDGYTGDFRYSVPLATLPGPNGENVNIGLNYHAGITVNQKASWVGLGWDYNPGEITRQVVNAPDDYRGRITRTNPSVNGAPDKYVAMYGSLYNNKINETPDDNYNYTPTITSGPWGTGTPLIWKAGDNLNLIYNLTATERCGMIKSGSCPDPQTGMDYRFNKHTVPYTGLAYDQYQVSGDGISGSICPQYLGNVQIQPEKVGYQAGLPVSAKQCQFYFKNSAAQSVNLTDVTNSTLVNTTTNRIHSGTFVKYFTNLEINNHNNLFNYGNSGTGYLDYKPVTDITEKRRPHPAHDPYLIGAFQITNSSGITYHYSLPVYAINEANVSTGAAGTQFNTLENKYATSWKLTAVTGPDYVDANGNYTADEGDTGYWISYNYSLWNESYFWASQRYNLKTDAVLSTKVNNYVTSAAVGNQYTKRNTFSCGLTEVYVLNYIKTASHTAYFVKSVRKDEQSYDNVHTPAQIPAAMLKLDRVVILRNENKNLLINTTPMASGDLDSRFSYTMNMADPDFINITRYNANKSAIDEVALTTAELVTDYSLAKKYFGNINNSFGSMTASNFPYCNLKIRGVTWELLYKSYTNPSGFSTTDLANSGKLTLKKIKMYNLSGEKITPSIDFAYDESSTTKNPDYDVNKTDLWGYYKKDYVNSHYVTSISKDDVDAWSLKEITTSLGGKINISYESDRYHREGFVGDLPFRGIRTGSPMGGDEISSNTPHLIFPVSQMGPNDQVTFHDYDFSPFYNLVNEPASDPAYKHHIYLIFPKKETCAHGPIPYNNGNSYTPTQSVSRLMYYGTKVLEQTSTYPWPSYSNGPYNYLAVGSVPEYNFNCQAGYSYSGSHSNIGVSHAVCFRSYLYGGGVRVKEISAIDPFSDNTYTQVFEYEDGYCPIVPKAMAFSTESGPSNHDVIANAKLLMNPQLTGLVGYSKCTQYSRNMQNGITGTVSQTFNNTTLAKPMTLIKAVGKAVLKKRLGNSTKEASSGNCSTLPDTLKGTYYDNTFSIDVQLTNNASLIGKLESVSNGVSTTSYKYTASFIFEEYTHNTTEEVGYPVYFKYERTVTNPCTSTWKYTQKDTYVYNTSRYRNMEGWLLSTSTTKDGITITESIEERDRYTGAPSHVKVTDPTKGVFDTYTTYAYKATDPGSSTLLYPSFDLKSKNESNTNVLSPVSNKKVIKENTYVISESAATYANKYPTRVYDDPSGKYINTDYIKPWYHLDETSERLLDDDVPATTAPVASDWRKLSTNTLYDTQFNCIEQQGLNARKTASKWGYNNLYKLAGITNANYNSFTFSGFEDQVPVPHYTHYGGEVTRGETRTLPTVISTANGPLLVKPHTGFYFASVSSGATGPAFLAENFNTGRTYVAKVWVHSASHEKASIVITLKGTAGGQPVNVFSNKDKGTPGNVTVGDWTLLETEVEVPKDFDLNAPHSMDVYLSNYGTDRTAFFDDFSFHPKDAVITGNVYNEKTGLLIAQLDNDNFATFYNYDNALRLTSTYKEYSGGIKKISESFYKFAKP